jgi:Tat protein secretion system quality control protein TatD with DNase activity
MGPDKNERNDPSTIPRGVAAIAKARSVSEEEMREQILQNYFRLFKLEA